jgi:hypothetical protein
MMRLSKLMIPVFALILVGGAINPAAAQAPQPQPSDPNAQADQGGRGGPGHDGFDGHGAALCSTVTEADIVAKVLGMSASDLRIALVKGQTISSIAASKNVTLQSIEDAIQVQRKADLDQALKDGLITQQQNDAMGSNTPKANQPALQVREIRVPTHNVVNDEIVAAKALNITCADLVKAVQQGKSVAQVATDKSVAVQAVIDAVVAAHKDALAADVKEGLITQAQADGRAANLTTQIGQWVYSVGRGGQNGPGGGNRNGAGPQGPQGGTGPGRGGRGGQPPAAPNSTPAAPATPAASS